MQKSVHKKMKLNNYLLSAAAGSKSLLKIAPLFILGVVLSVKGIAQTTYTTQADGDWNSSSTWVNGNVPGYTIAAGKTVNIKNAVTFSQNSNLVIYGTLNITDTLTYGSKAKKDIQVNAGGLLAITNGALVQDMTTQNNNLTVNGGRVSFINSKVVIGAAFTASNGAIRSYKNSIINVGQNYNLGGGFLTPSTDSIQNSLVETGMSGSGNGDFQITLNGILRVANAIVRTDNSNFKNLTGGSIQVLSNASDNLGFDILKTGQDLQNDGAWNARIDAACIGGNIKGITMADIDFTRAQDCGTTYTNNAPELIFKNPVLKSGKANSEKAVYRFFNVTTGVDAEITMKKFSSKNIVMQSFDLAGMGWDKAFQPQFGLPGNVAPFQNWYIDFELKFFKAGTNTSTILPRVDMTALDLDGDNVSIAEYAVFQNPSNVIYSNVSYLITQAAGNLGQTFTCPLDSISSPLMADPVCGGDGRVGLWNLTICTNCNGTGLLFSACKHPFDGTNGNTLQGPVENFINIDTSSTQVMATYQYTDVNTINFRYGATSGSKVSNAGIRLNSVWFRDFNLAPPTVLPVRLTNFSAVLDKKDVKLSWTGMEENFSHYVVQRSSDGKNYSDIAVVFTNNGSGESNYVYKDANVSSSTNALFYRLEMVDKEQEGGKFSDIRIVRLGKEAEALQITTYPNPAADQVKISLPSAWQSKPVMLQLFTVNGTMIQSMQIGSASQTESMQLGQLSKGFYLVKAVCGNQSAQQRIVKN